MREITEEWIFKAENDYRSAEALLYIVEIPIVDTACFHCQQCAEKYVKAYLEEHEVDFPRSHNLMQLLGLCIQLDESFETIRRPLQSLEQYAVTIRYPGLRVPLDLGKKAYKTAAVFVNLCGRSSKCDRRFIILSLTEPVSDTRVEAAPGTCPDSVER